MVEINLLRRYPVSKRPIEERFSQRTARDIAIAKEFGQEYFDGTRTQGYGGYHYNEHFWKEVVLDFIDYYKLNDNSKILDIGCAKGFMLYDFKRALPGITVEGIDISKYAIENAKEEIKSFLSVGNANNLSQFEDKEFDLVISINTIHNLPLNECKKALKEIQRVGKHAFITNDAWRNDEEKKNMYKWNLTAETFMHVDDWKKLFEEVGYTGDYYWFIAGDTKMEKKEEQIIRTNRIKKVLLTQPNYFKFGKRTWSLPPYALGILNACIKDHFKTELFDPNFKNLNDEEIMNYLRLSNPEVVGISTISNEYIKHVKHMTALVREALPKAIIIEGGILPSIALTTMMEDKNVNYWVIGEAEFSFIELLKEINKSNPRLSTIKGIAYYENEKPRINLSENYIENLDSIPFPDYGNLNIIDYQNKPLKYGQGICARRYPYTVTITSRGCPYRCVFCSGPRVSGRKVRMRSAENVLKEIDLLYQQGIKEIFFLDDHFLFDRKRAINIMKGLIERNYDLIWKSVNLTVFLLDEEILVLMKKSGCYQITVSIESGNQYVLNNIIKKPVNLQKVPEILKLAKNKGFEIIINFVIGFPDETWEQIRETFEYAEKLEGDLINFHIATPLPNTELMEQCIERGLISREASELNNVGYTQSVISTNEFTPQELQILRAFEWDRINFNSRERKENIMKIQGITMEELENWRKNTRRNLGIGVIHDLTKGNS